MWCGMIWLQKLEKMVKRRNMANIWFCRPCRVLGVFQNEKPIKRDWFWSVSAIKSQKLDSLQVLTLRRQSAIFE